MMMKFAGKGHLKVISISLPATKPFKRVLFDEYPVAAEFSEYQLLGYWAMTKYPLKRVVCVGVLT